MVQFTVPLSIIVVVIVIVVVVVIVVVIETANWFYKSIDYDNDKRFADNDNEGGRQNDTHASMVLNQAPFLNDDAVTTCENRPKSRKAGGFTMIPGYFAKDWRVWADLAIIRAHDGPSG